MKKQIAAYLAALLALSAITSQVQAISFVGSRGALGGNDFIDWGTAGPEFTILPSPFNIVSNGALPATVSTSNGLSMERLDQSSGWNGNFAPGDHLIWNQGGGGDIIIDFSIGIFGAGAQVQSDFFGSFTGTISAYDQTLTLLGSFNFNGNSTSDADNSAIFAGVLDTSPDIYRLVFSTTDQFGNNDFAINQLDLVTQPRGVPDTGATLSLMGLGILGIALIRRFAWA